MQISWKKFTDESVRKLKHQILPDTNRKYGGIDCSDDVKYKSYFRTFFNNSFSIEQALLGFQ